jgi:signal transduction histidine kinase
VTRLKQFPFVWFSVVIAVTLGMFLLLYWHVSNTFRVSQTLTNEYARGLELGSHILSTHLSLMYDAHLVVLDGDVAKVDSYRKLEQDAASYLQEARELGKVNPLFAPLASLGDLSLRLRQTENAALDAFSTGNSPAAEAVLHNPDYRSLGWALEARVADYMTSLNLSFRERLGIEANKELASLVVAFAIFSLSAAVWVVLMQRLRSWGQALESEMAQRRDAEEQLRRAQKMDALGQLAAGVSHDFNNILSVVQGFADVARNRLAHDHPAAEALDKIGAAAQQGTELTRSLLTFSGRTPADMGPVELIGLVAEAVQLFRETLPATVSVEVDVPSVDEGCWVWGTRSQLMQALANLVLNARDAMPQGGHLRIGLQTVMDENRGAESGWVRLQVEDTGIGIPEEIRDRVFEPFYTTKPRGRGTGLGLAVVATVVAEHQGRLAVDSHPGKGACFTVDLPRVGAVSEQEEVPDDADGRSVLVGLADAYTEELVISALEADGYRVSNLKSQETPTDAVATSAPHAVLLDAGLAARCLRESLQAAAGAAPPVPVLVLGDGSGELPAEVGADVLVLNRPFLMNELIRLIHNLATEHGTVKIPNPDRR